MKQFKTATVFVASLAMVTLIGRSSQACAHDGGSHSGGGDYSDEVAPSYPLAFYDMNVTTPETMRDFLWVIDSTYDL
jgi:hypothetical protein